MENEKKQYRQAFKATSLFGGVQVFQIIVSALKSKVVALFLGPTGMGIYQLLRTTVDMTSTLTNFGLDTSAVKFIAEEFTKGNREKAFRVIQILQNLLWITGLLGAILLVLASPFLSRLLFDSTAYTYAFVWLASAVLFNQLAKGRVSILQGLRKLKELAKANLWGSFLGLLLTAPLFYFFGEKAIVSAIMITFAINLFFSWYYLRASKLPHFKIGHRESIYEGKEMLKLGIILSFSGILKTSTAYLLQLYINDFGGLGQVGLYSAGILIIDTYGGLIFAAMVKDYYPRLAGIVQDKVKMNETVEHQAFIAILILTPVITLFLAIAPFVIRILLSEEFLGIVPMVTWGIVGLLFKAVAWSISYIMIAKGETKVYAITDISFIALQLLMYMIGYYLGGLTGLGIGFLSYHILYLIGIYFINRWRYEFRLPLNFYKVFFSCVLFGALGLALGHYTQHVFRYIMLGLLVVLSSWYSYVQLNKKIDFKELLQSMLKKK